MSKELKRIKLPEDQENLSSISGAKVHLVLLDGRTLLWTDFKLDGKTCSGLNGRKKTETVETAQVDEILHDKKSTGEAP